MGAEAILSEWEELLGEQQEGSLTFEIPTLRKWLKDFSYLQRRKDQLAEEVEDLEGQVEDAELELGKKDLILDRINTVWTHLDRIRDLRLGAFTSPQVTLDEEIEALLELKRQITAA